MADFFATPVTEVTPDTLAVRRRLAAALLGQASDTSPVRAWSQGAARLVQGLMGGYNLAQTDRDQAAAREASIGDFSRAFPGTGSPVASSLSGQTSDTSQPRGYRNNNPLNIEAGSFTQGQPGYAGSDGRFAKFASLDQGAGAANALLDTYQNKYGLNTPAGIVSRWAPESDGNNTQAYAGAVAKALGIGPNDPIPPESRQALIAAMAQHENGRPMPQTAAFNPNAGIPQQQPPVVAQALAGPQMAQPVPQPTLNPAMIRALSNQFLPPVMGQIAAHTINQQLTPTQFGFQTLPDGTIIRTDPRTGSAAPIFNAPSKPTFGVIGENAAGDKQYGFIDTFKRMAEPYNVPGGGNGATVTGPDGKPLTIPAGQNPKEFIKRVTETTADAMTGKKTEVQAKDEKFANKMELAEKNIAGLEDQGQSMKGRALEGSSYVPGSSAIGNYMQSDKYQTYKQARDNFITALLRDESGAAIGTSEFVRYEKEMFPQPGDGAAVVAQKREARQVAIEAMKKGAGPGYKSPVMTKAPVKVSTPEEAMKLPKGTPIILPDGSAGVVP
jgi:hypothetical protein